jgi:hypothetical protein
LIKKSSKAGMLHNIGNADKEVYPHQNIKQVPGLMINIIFLDPGHKKQSRPEPQGRKNVQ